MDTLRMHNGDSVAFSTIPVMDYHCFSSLIVEKLSSGTASVRHCVNYFGYPLDEELRLVIAIADDAMHDIEVFSCRVPECAAIQSVAVQVPALSRFEREISENHNITFEGHPWMKPLRTTPDDYPFYSIDDEELHEVGVGPIHAGVIEPGHFRFICSGEKVLNLEIMLGYQHRGIERLFLKKKRLIERSVLAESIAGDTAVSHSVAFASLYESLCGFKASEAALWARTLASELERIAIHTGDLSAICGDVAYQLGSAVYGRLRTPIINFMQQWCGNRLGKSCIRPFYTPYPFTAEIAQILLTTLTVYERDFVEMGKKISHFPSVLSRLEHTGIVTLDQVSEIGAVGMTARASGLERDIRSSHPYLLYGNIDHRPILKHHGDVYSRTQIRKEEVLQSVGYIRDMLENVPDFGIETAITRGVAGAAADKADTSANAAAAVGANSAAVNLGHAVAPGMFAISLAEGWRGEICHCAITDSQGEIALYKIKDPSFHNWTALELAVRGNEISDFPICNKSFNLSYCGHDL
ncbi:MAG: NADH-quinone oxidoreductase subunit C [Bacteroidales bacterium]|nr:NADH-quinone oxidoreductase subunit C [Bacteroidales bacterium]MDD4670792.1 NADH-quinone oxidoreductase subunit C [Bacteroidales bacterium]